MPVCLNRVWLSPLLSPNCEARVKPLLSSLRGDIGIITMNNDARRNVLSEAFFSSLPNCWIHFPRTVFVL